MTFRLGLGQVVFCKKHKRASKLCVFATFTSGIYSYRSFKKKEKTNIQTNPEPHPFLMLVI